MNHTPAEGGRDNRGAPYHGPMRNRPYGPRRRGPGPIQWQCSSAQSSALGMGDRPLFFNVYSRRRTADRVCDEERLRRCPFLFVTTDRGRPREMGGKAMSESVRVPGWLASGKSTPSSLPACRWVNCLRAILRGGFENGGSTPYLGITPVGHIQTLFTSVWGSPPGCLRLSNASADKACP